MTPEQYDEQLEAIKNLVQWSHRAAYEEAWRKAGGDPVKSDHRGEPVGWRKSWLESDARAVMLRNGLITGAETWK